MSGTQVHVHLFYGADPRRYRKGENIGSLYGYHHAESAEFALDYAQDASESTPMRFMRRGLKAAFGFDFIHAWRNRRAILQSDVIWTHTEQEHLAVALVLLMNAKKGGARPLLLAQSVWLLDRWPGYGALRRETAWWWYALVGTRVYPGLVHTGLSAVRGDSAGAAFARWRAVRGGAREARRALV